MGGEQAHSTTALTIPSITIIIAIGMQHPTALPIFLCLPCCVRGIPVFREVLPLALEIPIARFHEKEIPNFLPIRYNPFTAY